MIGRGKKRQAPPVAETFNAAAAKGAADFLRTVRIGALQDVKDMLAGGADVNARNENGGNALYWTVLSEHRSAMTELLVREGIDVNHVAGGKTVVQIAAERNNLSFVRAVAAAGADVNKAPQGYSPLMLAAMQGYGQMADLLLQAGADALARASDGSTAAQKADENGHLSLGNILRAAAEAQERKRKMAEAAEKVRLVREREKRLVAARQAGLRKYARRMKFGGSPL